MTNLVLVMMLAAGVVPAQGPALKSKTTDPADDADLQAALAQAGASGLPHRMLLVEHIDSIIEDRKFDDPTAFKIGVMAVLRHSDFSKDLVLGELYLRMLQQHVKDDILDNLDAAGRIMIISRIGRLRLQRRPLPEPATPVTRTRPFRNWTIRWASACGNPAHSNEGMVEGITRTQAPIWCWLKK